MADRRLTQNEADELVRSCMLFADRNGKTEAKEESSVHSAKRLRYSGKDFDIKCTAFVNASGNGSFSLTVRVGRGTLFRASGNMKVRPTNTRVEFYEPGPWVSTVRAFAKSVQNAERD